MKVLAALLVTAITLCSNCNTMTVHKTVNHEMYSVCSIEEKDFSESSEVLDVPDTTCHEFSTEERNYDTTIYQNVVVSPPWKFEGKSSTYLAWCDKYVPTSSWTLDTIIAGNYPETEAKIMEVLEALKLEVFHYAYEYDSKQGKFVENKDFYFEPYYNIEEQYLESRDTYHLSLLIYDSSLEAVEVMNVSVPVIYDQGTNNVEAAFEMVATPYGEDMAVYTYPEFCAVSPDDALEYIEACVYKFMEDEMKKPEVLSIEVFKDLKNSIFWQEETIALFADYTFEEGTTPYYSQLVFPIFYMKDANMPQPSTYIRTTLNGNDGEPTKNMFKFSDVNSTSKAFEDFEAVKRRLEIFVPEDVEMDFLHDMMYEYKGENTGLYTVLVTFKREGKVLEYLELHFPISF